MQLESFSTKKKRFCFAKKACFFSLCKTTWRRKALGLQKSQRFQLIQSQPIKKSLFLQHSKDLTSHRTQNNVQQPFSHIVCYCELAVQHPFFETSQSCVSTTASLSHRFKSSPAISGNLAIPDAAGYMMMAGHFSKSHVSSGDLNRPRSPEVRKPLGYFWFFSYKRKE